VQSIGGGVWMFSMLAFDHWGLNPERDNIQFRIIGDQSVMAQALATGGLSMGRISAMRLAPVGAAGIPGLADLLARHPLSGSGHHGAAELYRSLARHGGALPQAMVETIKFINTPENKQW
jgi:hypothetical protein